MSREAMATWVMPRVLLIFNHDSRGFWNFKEKDDPWLHTHESIIIAAIGSEFQSG
jgi:hypothetical protein